MKTRITIDLDLADFKAASADDALKIVQETLIAPARLSHIKALHDVRKSQDIPMEDKAAPMADGLLRIKLTLMAETNVTVETLPDTAPIEIAMPFERD